MKGQSEMELARAYIKNQQYTTRFSPMEGLQKGTIFPELYMPYQKKKSKEPVKQELQPQQQPQVQRERERERDRETPSWRTFGRGGRNG